MYKGINPDVDSYSAFFDNKKLGHTEMESFLKSKNVTDVFVCGIAYDVCVGKSSGSKICSMLRVLVDPNCLKIAINFV